MLATFLIEIVLLIGVLLRYKMNTLAKLVATTLFMLGFFQLAEYFVCGGLGLTSQVWSRLGFAAITTLPALGMHIIHVLAGKKSGLVVWGSYAIMAAWIGIFTFAPVFSSYECGGNYVIFNLNGRAEIPYSAYYYGILLLGIALAYRFSLEKLKKPMKQALRAMIVGYLVFLLPTAAVNTINPETTAGIPSIMCGFAVLFAFILYFYVLPRGAKRR